MGTASKFRGIAGVTLFLLTVVSIATAKYSGGTGEPNDPYQIATAADLIALGNEPNDYDKHFLLTADIDLDPNLPGRKVFDKAVIAPDTDSAQSGFQGTWFTGILDGQSHTISHLTVKGGSYLGLFGQLGSEAQVRNLGIVDANIIGSGNDVGGLAGQNISGLVTRCYSSGVVTGGSNVGGLVGLESNPYFDWGWGEGGRTIMDCYSTVTVSATAANAGGLVGYNDCGTILRCYSTGPVAAASGAGGLVGGEGYCGSVTDCFWDTGTSGQATSAGGTGLTTAQLQTISTFLNWGACEGAGVWTIDEGKDYPRLSWEVKAGRPIETHLWEFLTGDGTPEHPYLIYTLEDVNTIGKFPCEQDKHFRLMFLPGAGTPEDPYVIRNADDLNLLEQCPYGQDRHFRLGFLAGTGTQEDPYVILTADDLNLLARCPHKQDKRFRLGFLAGQGTPEDPYVIRTAEDLDLLDRCPHEQDKQFRLGFLPGTGTPEDPYVIRTAEDLRLLARCRHEQGKRFRLGFLSGTGTQKAPYQVHTADQLDLVGMCPYERSAHFLLTADIDLSGFDGKDGRPAIHTIGSFAGVFDGNGHTISYLAIKGGNYPGLFGQLASEAEVRDLGVVDVNVAGSSSYTGALVGRNQGSMIRCYSTGVVRGNEYVGGLAGENQGTMTLCRSTAATIGTSFVGGLVGWNSGNVAECYSRGDVSGSWSVGGVAGSNYGGLTHCYSTSAVTGAVLAGFSVGGLVGWDSGTRTQCYSAGPVWGRDGYVGGLAGGGGWSALQCFWDKQTSGQAADAGGAGKTTTEMQTAGTFLMAGWDFVDETANGTDDIWWIDEGSDYPRLVWDLLCPQDCAQGVPPSQILRWRPGRPGLRHDVYFGKDETIVASATPASPGIYCGRQPAETAVYEPGNLTWGTTYWWRVDEVDEADPGELWKGDVWSFTVTDIIVSPDPPDGAADVPQSQILSWKSVMTGLGYDVYFGETEDSVADATTASPDIYRGRQPAEATTCAPPDLARGRTYYWRIDAVDAVGPGGVWKGNVWSFTIADSCVAPDPADGATDVIQTPVLSWRPGAPGLQYDVYFGQTADSVADATILTPDIYRGRQTSETTTYTPLDLEWGKTYYWRIDEVDAAADYAFCKGQTWSFTVETYDRPIKPIKATASISSGDKTGPERTIDGSGLDALDQHSTSGSQMWLSAMWATPAWIQYQFDNVYTLSQMWVWNSNQVFEAFLGFGARDVTVEYSLDGENWAVLAQTQFARATATATCTANTIVDFGGVQAQFVRLTIKSNWGGIIRQYGLSEVRFFYVPVRAYAPQ